MSTYKGSKPPFDQGRRRLLQAAAAAVGMVASPSLLAAVHKQPERQLAFNNVHTGETLHTVYWAEGCYVQEGLNAINHILRDYRGNVVASMDPALMDLLFTLRLKLDSHKAFQVISGYRSPRTNALLRARSSQVAKNSLHTQGKAIDVRLPGVELRQLKRCATALKLGGVGYYPDDRFVHLDTGRVRYW